MTNGIHHITAIATNAVATYDFYTKILGLRLVKKTVNQDDVSTYHLFFGDTKGNPGMDLTFFIFQPAMEGMTGSGQVTTVSFVIPESAFSFWQDRFDENNVQYSLVSILGKKRIVFFDPDHLALEMVGSSTSEEFSDELWVNKDVAQDNAIRHFYSARLSVASKKSVEVILQHVFGYLLTDEEDKLLLYSVPNADRATQLEVLENITAEGVSGAGTVHHIAFRAKDEKQQLEMRNKVVELGLYPTPVINRFYFKSVYFRTPAGILFEIATDGPGFTLDENEKSLGSQLALPPFLESRRDEIEAGLPKLEM